MIASDESAAALAPSTYRLQLTPAFGFAAAAEVVPYLRKLGVTHVYLSPVFEASPGSTHGYDVTDPRRLRSDFGGVAAFRQLERALAAHGLRAVLDVVPNHMAATSENAWWNDVAENGADSQFAYLFDLDRETGGYRRFFDVNELVALRQEDIRVFAETHTLIRTLASRPVVDALRVDHIDGLRDPAGYLARLLALAPDQWLVVEKILTGAEALPAQWPVVGTTGYEFGTRVLGLFVDPAAREPLDSLYVELTGDARTWPEVARASKRAALGGGLAPDVERVARALGNADLAPVVAELAVEWPVYRTYTQPGDVSAVDRAVIESACARVRALLPARAHDVDMIERALLRESGEDEGADRFQLLTGPAMAKGVEDRAFYDYTRFVALNEVGGDPDVFGTSIDDWHAACLHAADATPRAILATATHDTKRGEDVRARLAAVSQAVDWWAEVARPWMANHDDIDGPTAYLLLQTVIGAWPLDAPRLTSYMQKAVREAGRHTSWAEPDNAYEAAVAASARAALGNAEFVEACLGHVLHVGRVNALAQTLLRLSAPGTPDTYQGSEFWDLSLVDPDNRRPVDFGARSRALNDPTGDGGAKLAVVAAALAARREYPHAFAGGYTPLETDDPSVVAYTRGDDVAVIVPVRRAPQGKVALPSGQWTHRLTGSSVGGGPVDVADLFARFPVALLCR